MLVTCASEKMKAREVVEVGLNTSVPVTLPLVGVTLALTVPKLAGETKAAPEPPVNQTSDSRES